MTFKWKIPAAAAGGAFLLSFFVGLIGRVGFGTLILRGFLWAIVFGALALGVEYLLRRFLPELFENQDIEAGRSGQAVDITLDEEHPPPGEGRDGPPGEAEDDSFSADEDTISAAEGEPSEEGEEIGELERVDEPDDSSDELPSLETVETAFGVPDAEERRGERSTLSIDALGIDEDPATVARAVRTFMNKDQKG